jgi:CspA family cold shock protein
MAAGKLLRYDQTRGYGFIAQDGGGEDVFVHANALQGDKFAFRPGALVEFEAHSGERGLNASTVRLVQAAPDSADDHFTGEDRLCDVLTGAEFGRSLVELFIDEVPSLTGAQMAQLRQGLVAFGRRHGWIDG